MRKSIFLSTAILLVSILSSCDLAVGIFKAGAYTAIFGIIIVIALIIWIISAFRGRS